MKKIILVATKLCISVANLMACKYIKGEAQLTPLGNGAYLLRCIGEGLCAKINCNGNDIDVYTSGGTIKGTLGIVVNPVENSDGTISIDYAEFEEE